MIIKKRHLVNTSVGIQQNINELPIPVCWLLTMKEFFKMHPLAAGCKNGGKTNYQH